MSVRRLSNSTISTQGRGKSSSFIASYSPGVDEMDLIERATVGAGGTANITFSNIPQTYQHLQIRLIARNTDALVGSTGISARFNDDPGSNYADHLLYGDGSSALAGANTSQTFARIANVVRDNETANVYAAAVVDILDYSSTTKNKTIRSLQGFDSNNANGFIVIRSSLWMSTSAITKIVVIGNTFKQHTSVALYGVRA